MRNWKLWGAIFVILLGVWFWQATSTTTKERAVFKKYPPMADLPLGLPHPPPPPAPKEPVDVWGWVVKGGAALTGIKTLLDIIDKFRRNNAKA